MNTQTCAIGRLFPANSIISAGPKLLAGFTEVPVNGIPKICTSVRVSPITKPATAAFSILDVTPIIAMTNTNVRITSTRNACHIPMPRALASPNPF